MALACFFYGCRIFFRLLVLPLCCLPFVVGAQGNKSIFTFGDFERLPLAMPAIEEPLVAGSALPYVVVKDARPDTTCLFFTKKSFCTIDNFEATAQSCLNKLLGTTASKGDGKELVVFIKKAWFTNKYTTEDADSEPNDNNLKQGKWAGALMFKADCFLKADSFYTPVFRYDTVFVRQFSKMEKLAPLMMDTCLKMLANKIARVQGKIASSSRKVAAKELEHNYQRSSAPILNATVINRGVYVTFSDFKNNRPVYTEFTVQNDNLSDQLYIKDSTGQETVVRNIWGYSDGKGVYIKSADNFFLLQRAGNTFYLYGAKSVSSRRNIKASSLLTDGFIVGAIRPHSTTVRFNVEYAAFQLDMDSGEIF